MVKIKYSGLRTFPGAKFMSIKCLLLLSLFAYFDELPLQNHDNTST